MPTKLEEPLISWGQVRFMGRIELMVHADEALAKLQEHAETKINRITSFSDLTSSFTNGKTDVLIIFTDDECAEKRLTFLGSYI